MSGNLTALTLAGGVPVAGDGTVSTIDALMADGGQATIGFQADAPVTNTSLAASLIALVKGLIATLQGFFALSAGQNIAASQVNVTASAALIIGARAGRGRLLLVNEGTTPVRFGAAIGVTLLNGALLGANATIELDTAAAVYGLVSSGSQNVSVIEIF